MREERDSMGTMQVPESALYGASTQRAVLNFPISGQPMPPAFVHALGVVKAACAQVNEDLGRLAPEKAAAITEVAAEIAKGDHDDQFPVDVFQTGSGTSSNMNANEVIANRASQLAGEAIGSKKPVHPNDDCNMGQSSNDVVPTTLHVAVALELKNDLLPGLTVLAEALEQKAAAYANVVKIGRTHLMDATPVTMGQVFGGYAAQVRKGIKRIEAALGAVMELAQGGTAVGTGINTHPEFGARVAAELATKTDLPFVEANNHFEAQGARDDAVEVAGHLATVAASLGKIAHDIRMLGSGPRSGLSELALKATQPGSSIMPGKVNPVMSEMLAQVCFYVTGNCHTVQMAGRDGHFELNVTIPLMGKCLLDSIAMMANGARVFAENCVDGLEVNEDRCKELVDRSLMLVTALNPFIGYDNAAAVAKQAFAENKTLREVVLEKGLMDAEALDKALDPSDMVAPKA